MSGNTLPQKGQPSLQRYKHIDVPFVLSFEAREALSLRDHTMPDAMMGFWLSASAPNILHKKEGMTSESGMLLYLFSGTWLDADILARFDGPHRAATRLSHLWHLTKKTNDTIHDFMWYSFLYDAHGMLYKAGFHKSGATWTYTGSTLVDEKNPRPMTLHGGAGLIVPHRDSTPRRSRTRPRMTLDA